MNKALATFLFIFLIQKSFCQPAKFSTYLQVQYTNTLSDQTKNNNPWSLGAGVQLVLNNQYKLKPIAELTIDGYFEDDKVLRITSDGKEFERVNTTVNFLAGMAYHPTQQVFLSFAAGPGLINKQTLLCIKPSIGLFFNSNQKFSGRFSYINVFNRGQFSKEDFSSISISLSTRLF